MKVKIKDLDAYSFCPYYAEHISKQKTVRPYSFVSDEENLSVDQAKVRKFLIYLLRKKAEGVIEIPNSTFISQWQKIYFGSGRSSEAQKKISSEFIIALSVLKDHILALPHNPVLINYSYQYYATEHDTIEGVVESVGVDKNDDVELLILSFKPNVYASYKAICGLLGTQSTYGKPIKRIRYIYMDLKFKRVTEKVLYPDDEYLNKIKDSVLGLLDSIKRKTKYFNTDGAKDCPLKSDCKCRI